MKYDKATAVRSRRKELGLRIEQVAVAADISVPHLYNLETGKCGPGLSVARRLAAALDTTLEALFPAEQDAA